MTPASLKRNSLDLIFSTNSSFLFKNEGPFEAADASNTTFNLVIALSSRNNRFVLLLRPNLLPQ